MHLDLSECPIRLWFRVELGSCEQGRTPQKLSSASIWCLSARNGILSLKTLMVGDIIVTAKQDERGERVVFQLLHIPLLPSYLPHS